MENTIELKKVKIDELELCLELLKNDFPTTINNATYKEIADLIQSNFHVVCNEQDMFLLHEPTIEQDRLSLEIHYKVLGLI